MGYTFVHPKTVQRRYPRPGKDRRGNQEWILQSQWSGSSSTDSYTKPHSKLQQTKTFPSQQCSQLKHCLFPLPSCLAWGSNPGVPADVQCLASSWALVMAISPTSSTWTLQVIWNDGTGHQFSSDNWLVSSSMEYLFMSQILLPSSLEGKRGEHDLSFNMRYICLFKYEWLPEANGSGHPR